MGWDYETIVDEDGERKIIGEIYNEKYLRIAILYESQAQAILQSMIVVPNQEEEEGEIEYFRKRRFVKCTREELDEQLRHQMQEKMWELEALALEDNSMYE